MKFIKKPEVIEAEKWTGTNFDYIMRFMQEFHGNKLNYENAEELAYKTKKISVRTPDGIVTANVGDWIIKEANGEFRTCNTDTFLTIYEPLKHF